MPVEKFSVSLSPIVSALVDKREGARSTVINSTLQRYFWLVEHERRHLRQLLTDGEIALLCDVTNGTLFADPPSIMFLPMEVQDGISLDSLDKKWQVDGDVLVAKLKGFGFGTLLTLVDAIQLWWHRVGEGEQVHPTVEDVLGSEREALRAGPERYPLAGGEE